MDRFLRLIRQDEERLVAAARGSLAEPVPSCPGWTVADLVDHVGHVYLHKVECMRQQHPPDPWPPDPHGREPVGWLEEQAGLMLAELTARGPAAPSYTWYPADQTVGFWYRRMAQETAVHRVDAELAVGEPGPVDSELAADGIDELLDVFFAGDWSDQPMPELVGRVGLRAGDRSWLVVQEPARVRVEGLVAGADAVVAGSASDLLLWLWGRRPDDVVDIEGDLVVVDRLRRRLTVVTD